MQILTVNGDVLLDRPKWANLQRANLQRANLDFSVFPLWCGSFKAIADDRLVWQLIAHIKRLDTHNVSDEVKKCLSLLDPYKNKFCDHRSDIARI